MVQKRTVMRRSITRSGCTVALQRSMAQPGAEAAAQHAFFLAEVSKQLASSLDYETTLQAIPRLAVPALADWCAVDILDEDGSIRRLAFAHDSPQRQQAGSELVRRYPPDPTAPYDVPQALRTGSSALVQEVTDELLARESTDAEHLQLLRELGLVSAIIVPLLARGRTLGALTFGTADSGRRYGEPDLALAEELAVRCALAIDNARLYRLAREAVQLRDRFLASVSHDLRSPLAAISGQSQLLRRIARGEHIKLGSRLGDGLSRIEATVGRMTRMIDELLDVARLELGRPLELECGRVDLVALVRFRIAEHQQYTDRHFIQQAGEPSLVGEWDAARLERVLDNLLSNAIKYSPDGGLIRVAVVRDEDEEGAWAILSVRDEGVGIPADDLSRIFEQFHRAQNVGRIGGTGVGLAITRQIVTQHGGSVTVDSREDNGSTFTVRLPVAKSLSS
jgi:signal transduction histidine kinase